MRRMALTLIACSLLSGCMSEAFMAGVASGMSGASSSRESRNDTPRSTILDDYYERQAREADEVIIRRERYATICRTNPTFPYC